MDIPFGSDSATVKNAMIAKGAVKIDSLSEKGISAFGGFSMSGRKVLYLFVHFVDNKAYEAYFLFNEFSDSDALTYYDRFSNDITAVYGKGDMTSDFGSTNNSYRIKQLELGNASCNTVWSSKNKNAIKLSFVPFNRSIQIFLDYQDTALWDLNAAKI